jgi:hypothetical protein
MSQELLDKETDRIDDNGYDDEFGHLADPPYPPKVALCGKKLRGVPRPRGEKPLCPQCIAVRDGRAEDTYREIWGDGWMN